LFFICRFISHLHEFFAVMALYQTTKQTITLVFVGLFLNLIRITYSLY
jgi:hypothetical protein